MAMVGVYENLKKLMEKRHATSLDGIIRGVTAGFCDVQVRGSKMVVEGARLASHIPTGSVTPGRNCSLALHAGEPYVVAIFPTYNDRGGTYTPKRVELTPPAVRVMAIGQARWQVTIVLPTDSKACSYELFYNDAPDSNSPDMVQTGKGDAVVTIYRETGLDSTGNFRKAYFAAKTVDGLGNESILGNWATDTNAPYEPSSFTVTTYQAASILDVIPSDPAVHQVGFYRYEVSVSTSAASCTQDQIVATVEPWGFFPAQGIHCRVDNANHGNPYRWFRIRSVDYAGNYSDWTDWVRDTTAPSTPTTFSVTKTQNGAILKIGVTDQSHSHPGFRYWELESSATGSGNGTHETYFSARRLDHTTTHNTWKYYRIKAIDWAGNASDWTAWTRDTTAPPVPSGFTMQSGKGWVTVTIDPDTDTSKDSEGFWCWQVWRSSSQAGTYSLVTAFNTYQYQIPQEESTIYWYKIKAFDWSGNSSAFTAAVSAWSRSTTYGFVVDNFDSYGGSDSIGQNGLNWLQVVKCESSETWTHSILGTTYLDTNFVIQGSTSLCLVTASGSVSVPTYAIGRRTLPAAWDLTSDGRFTNNDYICMAVYTDHLTYGIGIRFLTNANNYYYYIWNSVSAGAHYLTKKRSDTYYKIGDPSWDNITAVDIVVTNENAYTLNTWVDDVRIVKADPDDAAKFNDTGEKWDFADPYWHIYTGNVAGEPSKTAFSLGYIEWEGAVTSPATGWRFATHTESDVGYGTIVTGIYFKGGTGSVAIPFCMDRVPGDPPVDLNAYFVVFNCEVSPSTITVYKWVNGNGPYSLNYTNKFSFGADQVVWVGIDFRKNLAIPGQIRVYASTVNDPNVIKAANLRVQTYDTTITRSGKVGLAVRADVGYNSNVRFFSYRAGSPEHSMSAEISYSAYHLESPIQQDIEFVGAVKGTTLQSSRVDVFSSGTMLTTWGKPAIQFYQSALMGSDTDDQIELLNNLYYYSSALKYRSAAAVAQLVMNDGTLAVNTAASGTIDTTATLTTRFFVGNDGQVAIGSANTDGLLRVIKAAGAPIVNIDSFHTTEATTPILAFRKSDSDTVAWGQTDDTDVLGTIQFQGVNTSPENALAARIVATQSGTSGAVYVPAKLVLETYSSSGLNTNQLVLAPNGRVGIGTSSPSVDFEVVKDGAAVVIAAHVASDSNYSPTVTGYRSRNTIASPTVVQNNDNLLTLIGSGYDSVGFYSQASIQMRASGTWDASSHPTYITFNTTPSSSTTLTEAMRITSAQNVGIGITPSANAKLQVAGTICADGDTGGVAGTIGFTDVSDTAARSTGVGTIKFDDATARDSAGFVKIYIGTTAYYVPVFSAI